MTSAAEQNQRQQRERTTVVAVMIVRGSTAFTDMSSSSCGPRSYDTCFIISRIRSSTTTVSFRL